MPVIGKGGPAMRNHIAWDMLNRRCNEARPEQYTIMLLEGSDARSYPQITWGRDGSLIARGSHLKVIRGVCLVDVLDVDNANLNGWFVQPRATLECEREAGLIRVCKL